jgi:predicted nucleic acid-binding protein
VRRDCVLALEALAEFFHVVTRKRMVAGTDAAAQLRDWTTGFPTISADSGALWMALELTVDRRFAWWDALSSWPPPSSTAVKSC